MPWLPRSIADSLRLDGAVQVNTAASEESNSPDSTLGTQSPNHRTPLDDQQLDGTSDALDDASEDHGEGRGVTEDFSEIRDRLTRELWGVASLLAPRPPPPPLPDTPRSPFIRRSDSFDSESKYGRAESDDDVEEHNEELFEYDARDYDQYPELASESVSEDYYKRIVQEAVGITEEVLAFARNIAHHPETWLDFPVEEEEFDDMHGEEEAPEHNVVQARRMWMQELHKQTKEESSWLGMGTFHSRESADSPQQNSMTHSYEDEQSPSDQMAPFESSVPHMTSEHVIEKHLVNEIEFIDKSVIREDPLPELHDEVVVGPSIETAADDDNNDDDYWLTEDSELIGYSCPSNAVNAEEISFSDLEEDLDSTMPLKCKTACTEENKTTKTS